MDRIRKIGGIKLLSEIPQNKLRDKRVLLRVDFNLPIKSDGKIDSKENWRVKAVLPTIKYLLKLKAKIILLSHLGRPKGKVIEKLRLGPVQDELSCLLNISVARMPDCVGENIKKAILRMEFGEVLMLENLRFHKEEEKNDKKFAKELAGFGDFYINDAFSDSHRKHASIAGIAKYLPSCAGFLMEKELKMMQSALNPKRPAVAIIGGAKTETKLPVIKNLAKIYDYVLVGGVIANEMIKPKSLHSLASNIILPAKEDLIKEKYFDIGENTAKSFSKFIKNAKTIVWNGPMGMFEDVKYQVGTKGVIESIKSARRNSATILVGGGETICALRRFAPELINKKIKNFHISTGGGAMLEFLAGNDLPGIEVLKN